MKTSVRRDFLKTTGFGMLGAALFPQLGKSAAAAKRPGDKAPRPFDSAQDRPNIIFILADDLGYGDLGCYGQKKFRTPNIDRLAAEGLRFTQAYSGNAVCAPSRCVLMTGLHPGHAFIRDNREAKPEGQLPIPASTVTLPQLLKQNGYATGGFGKWGLGGPGSEGAPLRHGFDVFYGYNCQRHAHNYYPTYLWSNDCRVTLNNPVIDSHADKLPAGADPNNPASYKSFIGREYSADLIAEQARQFIRANKDRPFFLYLPTTVPHLALQVPEDSVAEYRGQWPDPPYTGGRGYVPNYSPRAAYAAMITRMDREVGRIMALVQELGLDEQTIFIFSSDNGPLNGDDDQGIGGTDAAFFNSAGGFRNGKGMLFEGGYRIPEIVRWKGKLAAGHVADRVTGFEDWLPTLLDLAGLHDSIPAGLDGISFTPTLLGRSQPPRPFLYREFAGYGGQQCIRRGDWKGIRINLKKNPQAPLELYNLKDDPLESRDVAAEQPDIVKQLLELMKAQHTPSPEFPLPGV